jgi:transcriptional regulator with GAF, ATPase, and Fis domain
MFNTPHPHLTDEIAEHAALYCLGDFPPEDRKSFEEHLSSCAVCRSEVEKCSAVLADLASVGSGSLPAKARANFLVRIRNEKANRQQWSKLSSVLITSQLSTRPSRKKNPDEVSAELEKLSMSRSRGEQELLDASVRAALDLCEAGTAGFSVLYEQEQVFRWDALAGKLSGAKGGTTPSTWSPCGTTLDFGTPQLFERPSRCFEYFNNSAYPIVEGLVVPVYVGEKPLGTLWIASHDDRKFDKEDLQVLQSIAAFCGTAVSRIRESQGELRA